MEWLEHDEVGLGDSDGRDISESSPPRLLAVNLNGMVKDGHRVGKKILPPGQSDYDLKLLKLLPGRGYRGPIGALGHRAHQDA